MFGMTQKLVQVVVGVGLCKGPNTQHIVGIGCFEKGPNTQQYIVESKIGGEQIFAVESDNIPNEEENSMLEIFLVSKRLVKC